MKSFLIIILVAFSSIHTLASDSYSKNIVDRAHRNLSRNILTLSNTIDEFFSNTDSQKTINKSKLKITFDTYIRESAGPYVIPDLNYRLVLPNTQNKLRLVFESDSESEKESTDSSKEILEKKNADDTNNIAAGLSYIVEKSGIKFSSTSGVIVKVPVDVFIKLGAKKTIEFSRWILKIDEEIKWINNSGLTSNLDLNFDRSLSRRTLLRFMNNFFWNDQDYVIRFENGPSMFYQISETKALSYHAHIISINEPSFLLTNYILKLTYRQSLYKDWIFGSLTPFINFPRENNFHRVPGAVLSLQAIFGHI